MQRSDSGRVIKKRNMQGWEYFLIGSALLGCTALACRIFEGQWIPPAMLFVFAYFSATFVYAYSIESLPYSISSFAYENFEKAYAISAQSFCTLLIGYIAYWFTLGAQSRTNRQIVALEPFMSPPAALLLGRFTLLLCACFILYNLNAGTFSTVRGENAYLTDKDVNLIDRIGFAVTQILPSLVLALFIAVQGLAGRARRKVMIMVWVSATIILIVTITSFNRLLAVTALAMLVLFVHYRISPLRGRQILLAIGVLLALQAARGLRDLGIPLTDLDLPMITRFLFQDSDSASITALLQSLVMGIAGWDVFTNVLNFVPQIEDYKYGTTYLSSLLGLLMPRVLGLSSYSDFTLSSWYMELYAPGTTNNGFDFSMLAEAYINFGYLTPAFFLVVGFLLAMLSRTLRRTRSPAKLFFCVVTILTLAFSLRSDSNVLFKGVFYKTVPVLVLIFMARRVFPRASGVGPMQAVAFGTDRSRTEAEARLAPRPSAT